MERLVSVVELSEILSLSPDRIYTLCRQQIIPHCRFGRTIRFSEEAISEFIANGGKSLPEKN